MAHVELSISEPLVPPARQPVELIETVSVNNLTLWSTTVANAVEPCLVIDIGLAIAAASRSCCELLGLGDPVMAVGRPLLDGALRLVDFTAQRSELDGTEIDKIPPLLALTSGRLARGLLRIDSGTAGETDGTVDAIATPIWVGKKVSGSLTFFAPISTTFPTP